MKYAPHTTVSTSNLDQDSIAQVVDLDVDGSPFPAIQYSNGTIGVIGSDKMEYYSNKEQAAQAVMVWQLGRQKVAQGFMACGLAFTLHGAAYCQCPEWVKAYYQGDDDQPCVGTYEMIWVCRVDNLVITNTDKLFVLNEVKRLARFKTTQPAEPF